MKLKDIKFKTSYTKAQDDVASVFYLPCMRAATWYDRISGFYGSTIYIIAWDALKEFIENKGHIRIICSPLITDEDKEAIIEGMLVSEDPEEQNSYFKEFSELFSRHNLEAPHRLLACLIAENILEVKVAIVRSDPKRLFHDKVGIFDDGEVKVAFRGSMNETFKGLSNDGNIESIDVYTNKSDDNDRERVNDITKDFNDYWNNTSNAVETLSLPSHVLDLVQEQYKSSPKWEELLDEVQVMRNVAASWSPEKKVNGRKPRNHQIQALENWKKNNYRGILEHATGSGKTFTALCAIGKHLEENLPVLILVPSVGLLDQWYKEVCAVFPDAYVLPCGGGYSSWSQGNRLRAMTSTSISSNSKRVTIAVMDTAVSSEFLSDLTISQNLMVVIDEAHRMGAQSRRRFFDIVDCGKRLGLSATPRRYGDPEGTASIINYFERIIEPRYSLADAIRDGHLTPYFYYPIVVGLTESEQEEWNDLTRQINKRYATLSSNNADATEDDKFKILLLRRSRILKTASNKINTAVKILKDNYKEGQRWIVYCDNQQQLGDVLQALLNEKLPAIEYHSAMLGDRKETLKYFEALGGIIVSIRCLDEGIDIPSVTHALILASSRNPREFIQRRGRILRKYEGKNFAHLYDTIVVPSMSQSTRFPDKIVKGELQRAIEFGSWSVDTSCIYQLRNIAIDFNIDENDLNIGEEDDEE